MPVSIDRRTGSTLCAPLGGLRPGATKLAPLLRRLRAPGAGVQACGPAPLTVRHAGGPNPARRPGGCDIQSMRMQEAGGRRWKLRNRGSRTPEGEVGRSTDAPVALLGVLRGWADCERGPALGGRSRTGGAPPKRVFGFFLHEQKETRPSGRNRKPPAGAGTGKSHRACRHPRQRAKEKRRPQAALLCHTRLPSHWARGI